MAEKRFSMGPRGPEKMHGWYSWRHETSAEHMAARGAWRAKQQRKRDSAAERQAAADARTPEQQLKRLDRMGMAATKERAKLLRRIEHH